MSYLDIDNLYKNQEILLYKECYALEKIHGTSANISYSNKTIHFFPGGCKYENFMVNFDPEELKERIEELCVEKIKICGEAYGGKCQKMRETYGDKLKFVAFEVKIGKNWLAVPQAELIVKGLDLEFIHYVKISTDLKSIDEQRDADSVQAIRNGMGAGKKREGVVLRPLIEVIKNNGERIISKHKREDFRETKTPRKVNHPHNMSSEKIKVLTDAKEVAEEWVTLMRLNHILGNIQEPKIEMMRDIMKMMIADVRKESDKEIVWNKDTEKAICKKTAQLFKEYFQNQLRKNEV